MLATNVKTTSDLLSIALQAEREAIRRYSQLTTSMQDANNASAAALFERMVKEEKEHERLLLQWMSQQNIAENTNIEPVRWKDPMVLTTYNSEACDPHHSTPYKALAFAVHNEEIAFRFYTHVAANSENKTVREYAETLAREELGHAALLRAERRRAYRKEREDNTVEPSLDPATVHNETDLLAATIHIDRYLVEQMNAVTEHTPGLEKLASVTQENIADNEKRLHENVISHHISPGNDITKNLEQLKLHNTYMDKKFDKPEQGLQRLWTCCDRSFAFYDAIVESAESEDVMLEAQKLTSSALDRIGALKQILDE